MGLYEQVQETASFIRSQAPSLVPKVGIILGSGLGAFADRFENAVRLPYAQLPHFPQSSVPGHAGRMVVGLLEGVPVVAMQGRVHAYEGYPHERVAFPARVLAALGVQNLIVTNAAGTVNASFAPGDLMVITDHINLAGWNPLTGPNDERFGPRFPDFTEAYSLHLRELLQRSSERTQVELKQGVYAFLAGPCYETPAEIRMLRTLGADAVGMSTIPEVIVARHMGVKVLGISCITNMAAGMESKPLSHKDVAETAERAQERFSRLLADFLPAVAKG